MVNHTLWVDFFRKAIDEEPDSDHYMYILEPVLFIFSSLVIRFPALKVEFNWQSMGLYTIAWLKPVFRCSGMPDLSIFIQIPA